MQIHCVATVVVVLAGIWLGLSRTEWCICLILFGLILGLELVNTAVEAVVDLWQARITIRWPRRRRIPPPARC